MSHEMVNEAGLAKKHAETSEVRMPSISELSKLEFFQGMSDETIARLLCLGKVRRFKRKNVFMRAREKTRDVYILLDGKAMIYTLTHEGKRKLLFILGSGKLLNENVANQANASIYGETLEDCQMLCIPMRDFWQCLQEDPQVMFATLNVQELKLRRLGHQMKNTVGNMVLEKKLASKLCRLARDFGLETSDGIEIDVNLSMTLLADMLGSNRENTSRAIKKLVELALISMEKKRIIILNVKKLQDFYELTIE